MIVANELNAIPISMVTCVYKYDHTHKSIDQNYVLGTLKADNQYVSKRVRTAVWNKND
jgi:hypothetical protein